MLLKMFGLKDNMLPEFIFFFQCENENIMKRVVKSALLSKERNAFTTDMKDKSVYEIGEIDTKTGLIKPQTPIFIVDVSEVRLELIKEIKIAKAEAGELKPDAKEVAGDE